MSDVSRPRTSPHYRGIPAAVWVAALAPGRRDRRAPRRNRRPA